MEIREIIMTMFIMYPLNSVNSMSRQRSCWAVIYYESQPDQEFFWYMKPDVF